MKYFLTLIAIILSFNIYAQDIKSVEISKYERQIRTVGGNAIIVELIVDFSNNDFKDFEIDNEKFDSLNPYLNPKLVSVKNNNILILASEIIVLVTQKSIRFEITNISDELMNQLIDDSINIHIKVDKDIFFEAWKNRDELTITTLKIVQSEVEKYTKSEAILTAVMAQELIDSKGGNIFISQNKIDFGIIPSDQASSGKAEYNASFKFRMKYPFLKETPFFLYTEGLISSNSKDSLNYISFYPVSYNFFKGNNELVGQLGIEGNQTFTDYRISGNFYWNGIIPNLIDLTFGENRLRLKPVVKVGFKLYQEIENSRSIALDSNEFSNQIYSEIYYYIPIKNIYSLILEGTAFYDFSVMVNPDKKIKYNYAMTLGIDIPKTAFKTIFKYARGDNMVSQESNSYLLLGLMVDLFGIN